MYLSEGFDAFLPKPVNPEKLEQMILRLLPRDLLKFEAPEEGIGALSDRSALSGQGRGTGAALSDGELPMVDGIDWSYGLMHLPDKELLLDTVKDFYKAIPVEADALEKFYAGRNEDRAMLDQYRIKVHSMKSAANLIGAIVLGGMARVLENAARNADIQTIEALHDIFIREWRSYREGLRECLGIEELEEKALADKREIEDTTIICSYLKILSEAFEEMDMDEMDQMMQNLEEYRYPDELQKQIEGLSVLVTNLDLDAALPLIEEILQQINEI